MTRDEHKRQLRTLSDAQLRAYWHILQLPCVVLDDVGGKIRLHTSIMDELLTSRGIEHHIGFRPLNVRPACPNGPDEHGNWPCEQAQDGSCLTCGWGAV